MIRELNQNEMEEASGGNASMDLLWQEIMREGGWDNAEAFGAVAIGAVVAGPPGAAAAGAGYYFHTWLSGAYRIVFD